MKTQLSAALVAATTMLLGALPASAAIVLTQNVNFCRVIRDTEGNTLTTPIPLKFDLARPATGGPYPLLIFIHGGGWQVNHRTKYLGDIQKAAKRAEPYVAATIDYRLSTCPYKHKSTGACVGKNDVNAVAVDSNNNDYLQVNARAPLNVNDVRCAIRYFKANAATYKIDPDRIAIFGESAGGHLALMGGLVDGQSAPFGTDLNGYNQYQTPNSSQSHEVQAVVDWFGATDLNVAHGTLNQTGQAAIGAYLGGGSFSNGQLSGSTALLNLAKDVSPYRYVVPGSLPLRIHHNNSDKVVPYGQSTFLDQTCATGTPDYCQSTLVTYTSPMPNGANHGFPATTRTTYFNQMYNSFLDPLFY